MNPGDPDVDPMESNRRAAAVNELLCQIGLSEGAETRWWNHDGYAELGDRTPTQAWLDGDHQAVEALVRKWYEDSEAAARRYRDDPALMAELQRRRVRAARLLTCQSTYRSRTVITLARCHSTTPAPSTNGPSAKTHQFSRSEPSSGG